MATADGSGGKTALGVCLAPGQARIWGMTGAERLARIFRRVGLTPSPREAIPGAGAAQVLLARADWVFDESLIKALSQRPRAVLVAADGRPVAACVPAAEAEAAANALETGGQITGAERLDPAQLSYNEALRKREAPVLEPLTADNVRAVEARLFKGSYKGVTDLVTKYWWPLPARIVTRWCALAGMTPNQVTFAGFLLTLAAFWLFWTGHFGWGLACGWVMTFLDTVDGKLARVTLTSSAIGNVFDHGIDLIHPPFWWWAWLVGVQATAHPIACPDWVLWVILGGYVVQRIFEGLFMRRFGFHVHAWRPFDSWFRLITARRNPNMILLTASALVLRPDLGLIAVAVWTAISLLVHLIQLVQAYATPKDRVASWLAA